MDKKDIISVPTLSILEPQKRFYIKKDWCKEDVLSVLLQEVESLDTSKVEGK